MNFLLLCLFLPVGFGFILNNPCPGPEPCRCYGSTINCGYEHLSTFPVFDFSNISKNQYREITIDLHRNSLTAIPSRAFASIQNIHPRTMTISLQENKISAIDDQAFSYFGNISVTLDLSQNQLKVLPHALVNIKNLNTLRLLSTSFVYLDGTVLTSIGKSLRYLWIDMSTVPIWPREFNSFGKLLELRVDKLPFETIPSNSFDGMTSLTRLEISNSKLHTVPAAICSLRNLNQLDFHHNTNLLSSQKNILTLCQTPLTSVNLAYFNYNNMFSFPRNVFSVFPRLTSLGLNFNNIESIDTSHIPDNSPLYYLYMSNNRFTRIPPAVSKFQNLLTLVVSNNQITSIDDSVLSSLNHLRQLTISDNPLSYIDPHAFSTSYTMRDFYMENTNLTSIPVAIMHSADRFSVQLMGSPIECTCSGMAFMHAIPVNDVKSGKKFFRGSCANIHSDLKSYIVNILPTCL